MTFGRWLIFFAMAFLINPSVTKALLFDVDGTLAETEAEGHLPAFNEAFVRLGIAWHWTFKDYADLLRVTGGFERMQAYARMRGDTQWLTPEGLVRLKQAHQFKNACYADRLAQGLVGPRMGLAALLGQIKAAGLCWAVVTTTSRDNWQALWTQCLAEHLALPPLFAICGEDVARKKPDPEAYCLALQRLGLPASSCLAVEDSPNGLMAAQGAGIDCLVVRSVFFREAEFPGACAVTEEHLGVRVAVGPAEFPAAAGPR